jgi:uncharacterized membrane protein
MLAGTTTFSLLGLSLGVLPPAGIHPVVSGAPLAFLLAAVLLEFLLVAARRFSFPTSKWCCNHLSSTVTVLIVLFFLAIILAFLSGYQARSLADQSFSVPEDAIVRHFLLARLTLFSAFALITVRLVFLSARYARKTFASLYAFFLILTLALVLLTSSAGGTLVFSHGAGVLLQGF